MRRVANDDSSEDGRPEIAATCSQELRRRDCFVSSWQPAIIVGKRDAMSSGTELVEMDEKRVQDILGRYLVHDKLKTIPAKRINKLAIFYWLAERFEVGRRYSEREVNAVLSEAHADFATLRRGLYDEYFFDRANGLYWRTPAAQKLSVIGYGNGIVAEIARPRNVT